MNSPSEDPAPIPRLPLLQVRGLTATRPTLLSARDPVLDDVSFAVHRGEIVAVCGESDSGLSLLAPILMRLPGVPARLEAGEVFFDERDLLRQKPNRLREWRRTRIGRLGPAPRAQLNPELTVRQHLDEAIRIGGRKPEFRDEESRTAFFYRVGFLDPLKLLDQSCGDISPLSAQRILLMTVLLGGAELLVCEDPTLFFDDVAEHSFLGSLRHVSRDLGVGMLFLSGKLAGVERFADRVHVFFEGRILESGTPREILGQPRCEYTRRFLGCTPTIERHRRSLPAPDRRTFDLARNFSRDEASG